MFSIAEKRKISEAVQKVLAEINHPEMPKEKMFFQLHVKGAQSWSFAVIEPNWLFDEGFKKSESSPWNEASRAMLRKGHREESDLES